jgi:hypothetical protein
MPSSKELMELFTENKESKSESILEKKIPAWAEDTGKEILHNLALGGHAIKTVNPIIGGNLRHVLSLSSGSARLQTNVVKRFELILSQPESIYILNPFEIRCCLCRKVISYPVWYYNVKYAINHFHYFICFDNKSPNQPSTSCYRRE